MFFQINVLKNFVRPVLEYTSATLSKRDSNAGSFFMNIAEFQKTAFS